jgi:hypothetical protein
MYHRGVVDTGMVFPPVACDGSRLVGVLRGQRLFGSLHQPLTDERAVLSQSPCDIGLANVAQVTDHPVELLERVIGSMPVAVELA